MIKLRYEAVDGFRQTKQFKLLRGARKYAQTMLGKFPEMGGGYAVSGDGVGKIVVVQGCQLSELFGDDPEEHE